MARGRASRRAAAAFRRAPRRVARLYRERRLRDQRSRRTGHSVVYPRSAIEAIWQRNNGVAYVVAPAGIDYAEHSCMTQPRERLRAPNEVSSAPLHIALVEPEIPPNTGNVARLCAATGCALHLIEPLGFSIDDRELKRAGLDYWDTIDVVVHPSLADFLERTAARTRWFFSTRAQRTYAQAPFARGDMLVFGRETKGLAR